MPNSTAKIELYRSRFVQSGPCTGVAAPVKAAGELVPPPPPLPLPVAGRVGVMAYVDVPSTTTSGTFTPSVPVGRTAGTEIT